MQHRLEEATVARDAVAKMVAAADPSQETQVNGLDVLRTTLQTALDTH
jgi:hypothetical protein